MCNSESTIDLRHTSRIVLPIPLCIEVEDSGSTKWKEITNLISVSSVGAGFYLNRRLQIGRLILISLPLPAQMRLFDESAPQYKVWALVRHCHPRSVVDSSVYHIGVAFTGKFPPASYKENPLRLYKIGEIKPGEFWKIVEDEQILSSRKNPRFLIPVEVFISLLDAQKNIISSERTVTENIGINGAAVFSNLDVTIGEYVKVICDRHNFSSLAVVRNRRIGADNLPRLHLEFVESKFPLEGID